MKTVDVQKFDKRLRDRLRELNERLVEIDEDLDEPADPDAQERATEGTYDGLEFIAAPLQEWLTRVGIKPIQIYPGSPWENGYNERFNGTLRREVLNAEWFTTTEQA